MQYTLLDTTFMIIFRRAHELIDAVMTVVCLFDAVAWGIINGLENELTRFISLCNPMEFGRKYNDSVLLARSRATTHQVRFINIWGQRIRKQNAHINALEMSQ